jgi:hypothetical protein
MFSTTVKFGIRAPVIELGSKTSPILDALIDRWNKDSVVSSVAIEWKSVPRSGESLIGIAEIQVQLKAETRDLLRKTYERLTRQITRDGSLQLSDRGCVLTEMFG